LSGTTVTVVDSTGTARLAALFYVSPGQINYEIPWERLPECNGDREERRGGRSDGSSGDCFGCARHIHIERNRTRRRIAVRINGGNQTYENVYQVDGANVVPRPIDLGIANTQVFSSSCTALACAARVSVGNHRRS